MNQIIQRDTRAVLLELYQPLKSWKSKGARASPEGLLAVITPSENNDYAASVYLTSI